MFEDWVASANTIMLGLIVICLVLTLWIKKNHYKKLANIRLRQIEVQAQQLVLYEELVESQRFNLRQTLNTVCKLQARLEKLRFNQQ